MSLTIAVDVDDVIALHVPEFIKFSNQEFGTNLTVEDYRERWIEMWKVDEAEMEERRAKYHTTTAFKQFQRIAESDIALRELSKKHKLVIVTARSEVISEPSIEWIERNFPGIFEDYRFFPDATKHRKVVTKAQFCRELGAEYLIDDTYSHCELVVEAGLEALLFGDYAWNREQPLLPGMTRVKDWPEVLEYFDGRA